MAAVSGVRCPVEADLVNVGQQLDAWTIRAIVHESHAWVVCDGWVEGSEESHSLLWVSKGDEEQAAGMLERAQRLAAAAARSGHRGLMPIRQVGYEGQRIFVAAPKHWGGQAGSADMKAFGGAAVWVEELLGALSALHSEKLAHGGIQGGLCRMSEAGGPQLMGYGVEPVQRSRRDSDAPGDWEAERYLAPESGTAGHEPTLAADVYALGVLLWEHMVGRPAFESMDPNQPLPALLNAKGTHPSLDPGPAVPTYLRSLIRQMTHPNPMVRLSTAADALEVLRLGSVGVRDLLETFRTPMPAFKRERVASGDDFAAGTETPVLPPPRDLQEDVRGGARKPRAVTVDAELLGGVFIGVMVGLLVVVLSLLIFSVLVVR